MNENICHICRRFASVGYSPYKYAKPENVRWFCEDCAKFPAVFKAFSKMDGAKIHEYEVLAVAKMTQTMGEYIDRVIGSTDIATWTDDEWFAFLLRGSVQFGIHMREVAAKLR